MDTHPVTTEIRDAPAGSATAGSRWIEVTGAVGKLADGDYDTAWLATTAVPGHTWVIETDQLRFEGVRCQIVYTFVTEGTGTRFRRDMTVLIADEADVDPAFEKVLTEAASDPDVTVNAGYLTTVKTALER
ncbi:hypothetical protein AB0C38_10305 [Amycolatopsis sp. NPDC048633]|uniref:hypothetical protein n=1 Tax=Amycolatopsis sp. NPDC048633 TaxID=3157095 RepID=UPI0033D88925